MSERAGPGDLLAAHPDCALPEKWSNPEHTIDEIANLFRMRQSLSCLKSRLASCCRAMAGLNPGSRSRRPRFRAFAGVDERRQLMTRGVRERTKEWRSEYPQSYFIPFVEARIAYASAWAARGEGIGSTRVSPEAQELFVIRLREAEDILLGAPARLKETTLWHHMLLAVALDSDRLQSNPTKVFAEGVKRWPHYYRLLCSRGDKAQPSMGRDLGAAGGVHRPLDAPAGRARRLIAVCPAVHGLVRRRLDAGRHQGGSAEDDEELCRPGHSLPCCEVEERARRLCLPPSVTGRPSVKR